MGQTGGDGMECVCRVPVVLGQMACRRSVVRQILLEPRSRLLRPIVVFGGADGFRAESCRLLAGRPAVLRVTVAYRLCYADGTERMTQPDRAVFDLPLPREWDASTRVKSFAAGGGACRAGNTIRVEALAEAFAPVLCAGTGALILTVGVFFIVRRERRLTVALPDGAGPFPSRHPVKGGGGDGIT